ncbi:MAG: hypothetical protein NVSMB47_04620 [Polyangiales bacterium]
MLLWGGTNAFNSSQDRDEGPVNLLPNPPPLPPRLASFGLAAKLLAVALAAVRGWRPAAIVGAAVVASVYYSWRGAPWRRGKEIGVVDNLINAGGTGFAAILLGYAFTPAPIDARPLFIASAFTVATFGGVPTSQIFQLTHGDKYSTARNYTSLLGAGTILRLAALCFCLHVALIAVLGRPSSRIAACAWWGWAALALIGAIHSLWWSRDPFHAPYARMTRQMATMITSQTLWTIAAWITTAGAA